MYIVHALTKLCIHLQDGQSLRIMHIMVTSFLQYLYIQLLYLLEYKTKVFFSFQNSYSHLDPTYKKDLDFSDYCGREKNLTADLHTNDLHILSISGESKCLTAK